MTRIFITILFFLYGIVLQAQTSIKSSNTKAETILIGNYNPTEYLSTASFEDPKEIIKNINDLVSADSLKSYINTLASFKTRNTGSDTMSITFGIGAARNWAYKKFEEISVENQNRLIPSFLQFDQVICGMKRHKNIFAVLPGVDTTYKGIIIIEGHIDSRCENVCDINCLAEGIEDNGSGSALVIELARVMSKMSFKRTIVFMLTIAEEQGLNGSTAFVQYVRNKQIPIIAVLNNDVIGGITCGKTSSPPSCPGYNDIDSLQVRLFSSGGFNSKHKQLSRFIKLQYVEELASIVRVPMKLTIMSAEDRTGRGGDHIPFREQGYAAMRFTSANEHGDADVSNPNYTDRQHTSGDILGVDLDGDSNIDSFYVDFNYLARNTVINGTSAAMAAFGPVTPTFSANKTADSCIVQINDPYNYGLYRVFVRSSSNDFDTAYTVNNNAFTFSKPSPTFFYISVASVDDKDIESLFSNESVPLLVGTKDIDKIQEDDIIELLQNKPNPFDEATIISYIVNRPITYHDAKLLILDKIGNIIYEQDIELKQGINDILYEHGYGISGIYSYSILVDGKIIGTKQMIFAN